MDNSTSSSKKRKRQGKSTGITASRNDSIAQIDLLEREVLESRTKYNNIAHLLKLCRDERSKSELASMAALSLCRVFARLFAGGDMVKLKDGPDNEALIVEWLRTRYNEFLTLLLELLEQGPFEEQVWTSIYRHIYIYIYILTAYMV